VKDKKADKYLKKLAKEYKKGFLSYFVLSLLKEKDMYGYEIGKSISEISKNKLVFQESGIYQVLKKLEQKEIISSEWKKSNKGPRRKYYKINKRGDYIIEKITEDCISPIHNTVNELINKYFPEKEGKHRR